MQATGGPDGRILLGLRAAVGLSRPAAERKVGTRRCVANPRYDGSPGADPKSAGGGGDNFTELIDIFLYFRRVPAEHHDDKVHQPPSDVNSLPLSCRTPCRRSVGSECRSCRSPAPSRRTPRNVPEPVRSILQELDDRTPRMAHHPAPEEAAETPRRIESPMAIST